MQPAWVTELAAHIALTDTQVTELEALRQRSGVPGGILRILIEQYPAHRARYLREVFAVISSMTPAHFPSPALHDEFIAVRMALVYHAMLRDVHAYADVAQENPTAVLSRTDAPLAPRFPTDHELAAARTVLMRHGWTNPRRYALGVIGGENAQREATTEPANEVTIGRAVFAILDEVTVPDAWADWPADSVP
jgi:hypothetical protein